jgi:hypothetical protein
LVCKLGRFLLVALGDLTVTTPSSISGGGLLHKERCFAKDGAAQFCVHVVLEAKLNPHFLLPLIPKYARRRQCVQWLHLPSTALFVDTTAPPGDTHCCTGPQPLES